MGSQKNDHTVFNKNYEKVLSALNMEAAGSSWFPHSTIARKVAIQIFTALKT
jgi:hypothetical protein